MKKKQNLLIRIFQLLTFTLTMLTQTKLGSFAIDTALYGFGL